MDEQLQKKALSFFDNGDLEEVQEILAPFAAQQRKHHILLGIPFDYVRRSVKDRLIDRSLAAHISSMDVIISYVTF